MEKVVILLIGLIVFTIPLENVLVVSSPELEGTLSKIIGALTFLIALLWIFVKQKIRRPHPLLAVLLVYAFWCAASSVWSIDLSRTWESIPTVFFLLLFTALLWTFGKRAEVLLSWINAYLAGMLIAMGSLYLNYFDFIPLVREYRYTGAHMNQNQMAYNLSIAAFLAYYLYLLPKSTFLTKRSTFPVRLLVAILILFAAIAVFLTGSRSGTITLASAVFAAMLVHGLKSKVIASWTVFGVVLIYSAKQIVPPDLVARLLSGTEASTFLLRKTAWSEGISVWASTPLTGIGYGCYSLVTAKGLVAHNTFVSVLVETGLIGLAILLLFLFLAIYAAFKRGDNRRLVFVVSLLLVWFLSQLAHSGEYNKITWFVFALALLVPNTADRNCHE